MEQTLSKNSLSIGSKFVFHSYGEVYTYKIIKEIESIIIAGSDIPDNDNVVLHSFDDQPACLRKDGTQEWWKDGKQHRDFDLAALIQPASSGVLGRQEWYQNGLLDRGCNRPARIYSNNDRYWFKDGVRHRDNGEPAVILYNGSMSYYNHGQLHRDGDKPAIINYVDRKAIFLYYLYDVKYDPS
jgi:hypothetical protein